jgi:hypothetical protein
MKNSRILLALIVAFCRPAITSAQTTDPVLVGAGDIAACDSNRLVNSQATATLLDSIPGTVFAAGDLAYTNATDNDFARCYDVTWGRHRSRTIPAVGNHEYIAGGAMGYYSYFGPTAGSPMKGYYSLNIGAWHIIVLNSECGSAVVGGCGTSSPQGQWLQADLTANQTLCTLAIWHRPLYTSDSAGSNIATTTVQPFWQLLYNAGAELVINGHSHTYERFAPQDPNGILDTTKGIREFIVGTGGEGLGSFGTIAPNSEVRDNTAFGVIKLTLHPSSYDWQFIPQAGKTFTDSGTQACH